MIRELAPLLAEDGITVDADGGGCPEFRGTSAAARC